MPVACYDRRPPAGPGCRKKTAGRVRINPTCRPGHGVDPPPGLTFIPHS